MAVESEEILSKISDLIESKVDELSTNLNNFRQEASNNNQTLENAIGSIKSVIDEKLSKIDEISSEINSIQTSVQNVTDSVSATNNKIDNILSQQTQLQRTVDSVSQNIEKLSTVTNNQLTNLSNQSQNITEKIDKLSLQQEREARTAAVEGARGTVVVDSATGKTVSGVAAADATGTSEETKQSLIGSVLSGIKGILTSPLALGAALGTAALGTAYALRKEPPGTPQAGSDAEFNIPRDTSGDRRTGIQESYTGSLDNINKAQLAFIRGLGMTETHFRNEEAYSERYNKPSNNANVRKYGQAGADYGYYQTNELDVKDAIRRGVPKEIARHLHGGGRGGKSTIEEQTLAMHEYLKKLYPKEYNRLEKDPSPKAFEALRQRARRKWFGLKDRPHVARKEFRKFDQDVPSIFPEMQPRQETETAPQPDARREQTEDRKDDGSFQYRAPVTGTVVGGPRSHFGAPRSDGRRSHSGNDYQAKNGSPVTATLDGQVVHVGNHSGYGWTIDILHPDGNVHRYATHGTNPAKFGIEKGMKVEAGQQIGTIGKGHLHYEVIEGPWYRRTQKRNNGGFVSTSRVRGKNPSVFDPSKVIGVPHKTRITGGEPYKPSNQDDSPSSKKERRKQAIQDRTFDFRDLPSNVVPPVSSEETGSQESSIPDVPGITVTRPTPDRMNLGARGLVPSEKPVKDPYEQFKGSIVSTYDLDRKVVLSPPRTDTTDTTDTMKQLLKMIKKQEQPAQQAQPQSQKVLGNLTGPEFFDPRTLKKFDENTKGDDTAVRSAPPPSHKKPKLNLDEIYT